jgi:hypothetical protein
MHNSCLGLIGTALNIQTAIKRLNFGGKNNNFVWGNLYKMIKKRQNKYLAAFFLFSG